MPQAQPAIYGGGLNATVTEGCTWRFTFSNIVDAAGTAIDLTAATGAANVYDADTSILALTFAGASGSFTLSATTTDTAGLANSIKNGRKCTWRMTLTSGSNKIEVWNVSNSRFVILPGTGVA